MKFRNIPVEIDAIEFDGTYAGACHIVSLFKPVDSVFTFERNNLYYHKDGVDFAVKKGAWIIKDMRGEIYPCKPNVFKTIYEPAIVSKEMQDEPTPVAPNGTGDLYCSGCGKPRALCSGGTTGCQG